MVSIKLQSRGVNTTSIVSYFWNSNRSTNSNHHHHHHNTNTNTNTNTISSATHHNGILIPPQPQPPILVTLLPLPKKQQQHQQHRLLVSILLGTFVFITMVIPILRFVRYDDSHLFQSMLLLDTTPVSTSSSSSSSSSSSATVTLLDVALGKAPLSDYVQSSSSSSSIAVVHSTNQINHKDLSTLRQQLPSALRHPTSDLIQGSAQDVRQGEVEEINETKGEEDDGVEEENVVPLSAGGETSEVVVEEEEEDEHVIQPTQRTIPPFHWENELQNADHYIQSFTHVGRTRTSTTSSGSTTTFKKNKKKKKKKQKQDDQDEDPPNDALLFFHIPKTAGTAIEYAAGMNPDRPLAWGSCRFNHKPKRDICHYPKNSPPWPQYVGWWHLPVQLFPIAGHNPYKNAELFGVVRDPYDRMVSEFYYICTLKVMSWRPDQCDRSRLSDVNYMNEWLSNKIRNRETDSGRSYLIDNGHFTPQYDYIYGPNQVRMLDYVLFMDSEHFNENFATLMQAYELPNVKLQKLNALGAAARGDTHFDTSHLDNKTIQWIHNMYPDDFSIGGYAKKPI